MKKSKISAKGQYGSPIVLKGGVPTEKRIQNYTKRPHYKYNVTF